jgi:hypothetical protein
MDEETKTTLANMTMAELKEFATKEGISGLDSFNAKAQVLSIIENVLNARASGTNKAPEANASQTDGEGLTVPANAPADPSVSELIEQPAPAVQAAPTVDTPNQGVPTESTPPVETQPTEPAPAPAAPAVDPVADALGDNEADVQQQAASQSEVPPAPVVPVAPVVPQTPPPPVAQVDPVTPPMDALNNPAPLSAEQVAPVPAPIFSREVVAPAAAPVEDANDQKAWLDSVKGVKEMLAAQPKVKIYVPLEPGEKRGAYLPVIINGFRTDILKGVYVEVAQSIADIVSDSYNQTADVGRDLELGRIDPETGRPVAASMGLQG